MVTTRSWMPYFFQCTKVLIEGKTNRVKIFMINKYKKSSSFSLGLVVSLIVKQKVCKNDTFHISSFSCMPNCTRVDFICTSWLVASNSTSMLLGKRVGSFIP